MDLERRLFLKQTVVGLAGVGSLALDQRWVLADSLSPMPDELSEGPRAAATLEALPGKQPLIKRTYRPPNYETPLSCFNEVFTPNDAFFVRYHNSIIPQIDARQWKLRIGGEAATRPLELTLAELKRDFPQVELAALCLCAGNRRGLFEPQVPGLQWGHGAMGNALWKGVRLRDVLHRAGVGKNALEVTLDGADTGVLAKTPDFVKSLPIAKALEQDTLIAFEMNGEPLPHWNGFPARLVVPGWLATYWVKHLTTINLVSTALKGFWMSTAYRIPKDRFPVAYRFATQESGADTPVTVMVVNSLITRPAEGSTVSAPHLAEIRGIAWDGDSGIAKVEVSLDHGRSWREAQLGKDYGRYSWRPWAFDFRPAGKGEQLVLVRASNRRGVTQPVNVIANPAGYHHNAVQKLRLHVV